MKLNRIKQKKVIILRSTIHFPTPPSQLFPFPFSPHHFPKTDSGNMCIYVKMHACIYANIHIYARASNDTYTNTLTYESTQTLANINTTSLELVDKFTYLGSSVSSTEKDIDTWLTWKSNLTDKIKRSFFQAAVRVGTAVWMHYMDR